MFKKCGLEGFCYPSKVYERGMKMQILGLIHAMTSSHGMNNTANLGSLREF